jgi:hypothetical protein
MFEQRILCHKLPKSFDFIKVDIDQEQCVNKHNKIIQVLKRRMLNVELEKYENKIEHYEHLYQQDLSALESQISNPTSSDQKCQTDILMHFVKLYFNHHTNRLISQIRFKESRLHVKLTRHRCDRASSKKKVTDVYPQTIVDVPKVSLNRSQLDYLSRNGKSELTSNSHYNNLILYRICVLLLLFFPLRAKLYQTRSKLS